MSASLLKGRYRLVRPLGSGAAGSVYEVEDLLRRQRVALKALVGDEDRALVAGLRREFSVLAALNHPDLARVYDFGRLPRADAADTPQGAFFTRELVDGVDLAAFLVGQTLGKTCRVLGRVASALEVLHRAGMVHRDLKPANVIIEAGEEPRLIDFGLASGSGRARQVAGTAPYLSPELLRGDPIDGRADLYALGMILLQSILGALPLEDATVADWVAWHLRGELPIALPSNLPAELTTLLRGLLARAVEQRPPTAAEAATTLARLAEALGEQPLALDKAPFVEPNIGRPSERALARLEEQVSDRLLRRSDSAPLVALTGDPGSGRRRLLVQLSWRSQLSEIEVIRVASEGQPLAELIAQVAGALGLAAPSMVRLDDYSALVRIATFLAEAAEQRALLVVIENLDRVDNEQLAALRFVAHSLASSAPLLIVVACSADQAIDHFSAWPLVELGPLALDDVRDIVRAVGGQLELAPQLHAHSGGNRRIVLDALRHLAELGWPSQPELGRLTAGSLKEVYLGRYGDLDRRSIGVLERLAVFGELRVEDIARAECVSLRAVQSLLIAGWLREASDGRVGLRSEPLRNLVLERISADRARSLHRRAAETSAAITRRVEHWLAAGMLEQALDDLPQALDSLEQAAMLRSAVRLLHSALEQQLPSDRALEFSARLARLLRAVGELREAEQVLLRIRAELTPSDGRWLDSGIELVRVLVASGRHSEAMTLVEELVQCPVRSADRHGLWVVAVDAAGDQHQRAIALAEAGLKQQLPDALRAELITRRAWASSLSGEAGEHVDSAFAEAHRLACGADDLRTVATVLNRWAAHCARHGELREAEQKYHEALEALARCGDVEREATVRLNAAALALRQGDYGRARNDFKQTARLFTALGADVYAASARCNQGFAELQIGLYEQARQTLERALALMIRLGRKSGEALARALCGIVAARQGRLEDARRELTIARQTYAEIGQHKDVAECWLDLAEIELRAGHLPAAAQALAALSSVEQADQRLRADLLEARLQLLRAPVGVASALSPDELIARAERIAAAELLWQAYDVAAALEQAAGRASSARKLLTKGAQVVTALAEKLPVDHRSAFWQDDWRRELSQRAGAKENRMGQFNDQAMATTLAPLANPASVSSSHPEIVTAIEERFYRLLEIYRRLNTEHDVSRLLELVMDTAVELTGAERGLLLIGDSAQTLEVRLARNIDTSLDEAYSRSIAESVAKTRQPVISVSARTDPRFTSYASVHDLQLESILCIPIEHRGRCIGVLYMESRFQSGRFSARDQRLLLAFGDQVAIALRNAELLENNRKHAEALGAANQRIEALAEERGQLLAERTEELQATRRDLRRMEARLRSETSHYGIVGKSAPMTRIFEVIERVAATDVPVLIEGESGTGKEMVARAIHLQSARSKRPIVAVNCAAIPEGLLESELFGHVRGAFTGADRERRGVFVAAHGGTLFLDELGDMPAKMQVDLLRALQEKVIRPVGGSRDIPVDVRLVAATNRPLAELVKSGHFREDLFYRLHVVRIELPPLRRRKDDIPLLVEHFLKSAASRAGRGTLGITKAALSRLVDYPWPGNVRQLEHALVNAAVMAEQEILDVGDFTLESPRDTAAETTPLAQTASERQRILGALERCNWNKSRAAEEIGMPRRTFYRRLRRYGIS